MWKMNFRFYYAVRWRIKYAYKKIMSIYYFGSPVALVHGRIRVRGRRNVFVGKGCSINHSVTLLASSSIILGDYVVLSPYVQVLDAGLEMNALIHMSKRVHYSKPIIIGSNTWVATCAIILPGVELGKNCLVGAGSVVTKSFPDNSFIAGNPASLIYTIE